MHGEHDVNFLSDLCEKPLRALRLKHVFALLAGVVFTSINSLAQLDTAIVRTFGGPYYEEGRQIIECAEGGYAIIGTTGSDQLNNTNFYLLRLDEELNCLWSQNYGGAEVEWGYSIVEDVNNNLLVCGYTNSYGEGGYDILVYKVDPLGNVIWQKTYGGSDWDFAYKMIAHPEEGYLICGKTYSYGNGGSDAYLLHISEDGNLINEWTYGGEGDDEYRDIEIIDGSSIVLCGYRTINNLKVSSVQRNSMANNEILWEISTSDNEHDFTTSALDCTDSTIMVCGVRASAAFQFGYYQRLSISGEELNWFSIDENNSSFYYDIAYLDNRVNIVGGTRAHGYGGMDCIMYRLNADTNFEGGFFYGDTSDDVFNSLLINPTKMILAGARQNPETHQWSSLVMLYTKSILTSENNMDPVDSGCFAVEIEPIHMNYDREQTLSVYDIRGKLLVSNKNGTFNDLIANLSSGLYIVASEDNNFIKKVLIP